MLDKIMSFSWKVYAGAALAGVLAVLRQQFPDQDWIDYALAALAGLGFTVNPAKKEPTK